MKSLTSARFSTAQQDAENASLQLRYICEYKLKLAPGHIEPSFALLVVQLALEGCAMADTALSLPGAIFLFTSSNKIASKWFSRIPYIARNALAIFSFLIPFI